MARRAVPAPFRRGTGTGSDANRAWFRPLHAGEDGAARHPYLR